MDERARFLHECGMLKRVPRSGWEYIGAPKESVAEHSFRAVVLGHMLSRMAGLGEEEELLVLKGCLYHDLHEARLGDLHIISKKYLNIDTKRCEMEQRKGLPEGIKKDIEKCLGDMPEKIRDYVHDADKLEAAITAKEYLDLGYKSRQWIENAKKQIRTKEGKELLGIIQKGDSLKWIFEQKKK